MAIYLANIVLLILERLLLGNRTKSKSTRIYCGIVALQWILVSGLRDWSVGADTYTYYASFERVKNISWSILFRDVFDYLFCGANIKDPGYALLVKLFQIYFKDYQVFLIGIAALFMVLMAVWIYKNSASPCTAFIIFSTLFYSFYAVTGHRQTIATALIVFCGYELIKEQKLWQFALVSFVAFLIHKSSIVFIPFYFLAKLRVTFGVKATYAATITVVAFLGKRIYGPIALWMGFSEEQIEYATGGAELFATLLALLSIIILIFYPQIQRRRSDAGLLFHATAMTLMSALLVIQNQGFMRIQQYYSLFIMITIPELLNIVKRRHRPLVYLAFGIVMIMYLIRNNPYYRFFWS